MKKLLSILLSMTMVFSYAPVLASAKENTEQDQMPIKVLAEEEEDDVTGYPFIDVDYLYAGDTYQIEELSTKLCSYVFTSSDESVATVDENGLITAVGEGEVTISYETTFLDEDYQYEDSTTITVYASDYRKLQVGDNTVIASDTSGEPAYRFVVETTGYYEFIFTADNSEDYEIELYEDSETFNEVAGNYQDVMTYLEGGKTYYAKFLSEEKDDDSTTVSIVKADDQVVDLPADGVITDLSKYYVYVPETTGIYEFACENEDGGYVTADLYKADNASFNSICMVSNPFADRISSVKAGQKYYIHFDDVFEEDLTSCTLYIRDASSNVKALSVGSNTIKDETLYQFTPSESYYYEFTGKTKYGSLNVLDESGEIVYSASADKTSFDTKCYLKAGITYTVYGYFSSSVTLTISKAKAMSAVVANIGSGVQVAVDGTEDVQNCYDTSKYTVNVYRKTSSSGKYSKIANMLLDDNTTLDDPDEYFGILDSKRTNGSTYYYALTILDENGKVVSGYSTAKSIKYLTKTTAKLSNTSSGIKLSWNKNTKAKGYYVYRFDEDESEYKKIKTITSYKTTTYTDKSAKNGTQYSYYVVSYNGSSKSDHNYPYGIRLTGVSISSYSNISGKKLKISWKSNKYADHYELTYSTSKSFKSAKTISVDGTSYTLSGLTKKKTYYFKVRVVGYDESKSAYSSYKYKKITK